jgi:hypothetical protein
MTQVESVKDADRQVRWPRNRFQFVDGTQNFHDLGGLSRIAHKSLEICERCRLWQQNSPATAEKFYRFWERRVQNTFVSIHLFLKPAQHHIPSQPSLAVHKTGVRQDMVLGFLTRNELVDS